MTREAQTSSRRIRAAERRRIAIRMRKEGATFADIAAELGVSRQAAHKMVKAELDAINTECAEETANHRRLELDRLDNMHAAIWPMAMKADVKAIDRILAIMVRRSKLLGLDAPTRRAHEFTSAFADVDFSALTREQLEAIRDGKTPEGPLPRIGKVA